MTQATAATTLWCPRCLRPVGAAATCPGCGLGQQGADAARLRVVVRRLYELGEQRRALEAEAAALGSEQARLLGTLARRPSRARSRPRPEWRAEVVRGLLLGLGSVLVALAALIFAAVTWVRLGDLGRAGLLAAATLVVAAAAAVARRRLPATAEALGGLALALLLVDWYALGRAGAATGWPASAWWALGTGTAAAAAAAAGRWLRVQRPAAAALVQVSALLVVCTVADAAWTAGTGLALVAAVAAGAASRSRTAGGGGRHAVAAGPGATGGRRGVTAFVLGAGAAVLELAALGLALVALATREAGPGGAAGPAMALAAMALAPAAARAMLPARPAGRRADALVAAAAGALLAGAGALLTAAWTSWPLAAAVAVLGAAGAGAGRALPRPLRPGTTLAAGVTLAVGLAGLAEPVLWSLAGPTGWAADPWTAQPGAGAAAALRRVAPLGAALAGAGAAIVGLLAAAAGAGLAALPGRGPRVVPPWVAVAAGLAAGVGIVAVLPLAAGWPLWAATVLTSGAALLALAGSVLADRRGAGVAAGGAAAALLGLAGLWALATEAGTLALFGALVPAGVAAAGVAAGPWLRRACGGVAAGAAVVEGAAVAGHLGAGAGQAGVAVALAGGVVLVAGARWRRGTPEGPVVEAIGLAGLAAGMVMAAADQRRLAEALSLAVPVLVAAARPGRRAHLWAGAAVAVAATWAWLVAADVVLLEAYTLPAAAAALAAGLAARSGRPHPGAGAHPGSWPAYGPGLALGLLPSLALAAGGPGPARPLLLSVGALLVVLAGARARLQAPLVLGAAALVVLAVDASLPVAARLPRWATVGGSGLLLLWLGATAERRLARIRGLHRRLRRMEPGAAAGRGRPGRPPRPTTPA